MASTLQRKLGTALLHAAVATGVLACALARGVRAGAWEEAREDLIFNVTEDGLDVHITVTHTLRSFDLVMTDVAGLVADGAKHSVRQL